MCELILWMVGREFVMEKLPCFLGITLYDVGLRFQEQVEKMVKKAKKSVRVLRSLSLREWGWCRDLLRTTCIALVRAVLLSDSAAWAP